MGDPHGLVDDINHALPHGCDHLDVLLIGWLGWFGWARVRLPK
jgi:hypothetical protein